MPFASLGSKDDLEQKMFEDKIDRNTLNTMPDEYQQLLARVLTIQADCEIGGPHLYVKDILLTAPTKVDQLIVARTAAEEMDHYRKIALLAGEIGVDTSYLLSIPNQKRYLEAFRGWIQSWEDFAAFGFLIDRVGRFQLEEFLDCSYLPLQRIWPSREANKKKTFKRALTFGTSKRSTCSAALIQIGRIDIVTGA
jgi:1,2-phenylacetyl-CoA epoxidase catalytic subunit